MQEIREGIRKLCRVLSPYSVVFVIARFINCGPPDLGPDYDAKFCSFEKSFKKSFEYFSNSFVKEVFKGLSKGLFKGAKFCIVIGTLVLSAHGHDL